MKIHNEKSKKTTLLRRAFFMCVALLFVYAGINCSKGGTTSDSTIEELGLPTTHSKVLLEERFSSLTSEIIYLKLLMTKSDTKAFNAWVAKQKNPPLLDLDRNFPPLIEGSSKEWSPKATPKSVFGSFYTESPFYHWSCKYMIDSKDSSHDILYLYAIDVMN